MANDTDERLLNAVERIAASHERLAHAAELVSLTALAYASERITEENRALLQNIIEREWSRRHDK